MAAVSYAAGLSSTAPPRAPTKVSAQQSHGPAYPSSQEEANASSVPRASGAKRKTLDGLRDGPSQSHKGSSGFESEGRHLQQLQQHAMDQLEVVQLFQQQHQHTMQLGRGEARHQQPEAHQPQKLHLQLQQQHSHVHWQQPGEQDPRQQQQYPQPLVHAQHTTQQGAPEDHQSYNADQQQERLADIPLNFASLVASQSALNGLPSSPPLRRIRSVPLPIHELQQWKHEPFNPHVVPHLEQDSTSPPSQHSIPAARHASDLHQPASSQQHSSAPLTTQPSTLLQHPGHASSPDPFSSSCAPLLPGRGLLSTAVPPTPALPMIMRTVSLPVPYTVASPASWSVGEIEVLAPPPGTRPAPVPHVAASSLAAGSSAAARAAAAGVSHQPSELHIKPVKAPVSSDHEHLLCTAILRLKEAQTAVIAVCEMSTRTPVPSTNGTSAHAASAAPLPLPRVPLSSTIRQVLLEEGVEGPGGISSLWKRCLGSSQISDEHEQLQSQAHQWSETDLETCDAVSALRTSKDLVTASMAVVMAVYVSQQPLATATVPAALGCLTAASALTAAAPTASHVPAAAADPAATAAAAAAAARAGAEPAGAGVTEGALGASMDLLARVRTEGTRSGEVVCHPQRTIPTIVNLQPRPFQAQGHAPAARVHTAPAGRGGSPTRLSASADGDNALSLSTRLIRRAAAGGATATDTDHAARHPSFALSLSNGSLGRAGSPRLHLPSHQFSAHQISASIGNASLHSASASLASAHPGSSPRCAPARHWPHTRASPSRASPPHDEEVEAAAAALLGLAPFCGSSGSAAAASASRVARRNSAPTKHTITPSSRSQATHTSTDNHHARIQPGSPSEPLFIAPSRARSQLGRSARHLPVQRLLSDDDASPGFGSQGSQGKDLFGRTDCGPTVVDSLAETCEAQHVRVLHRLSDSIIGNGEADVVRDAEHGK